MTIYSLNIKHVETVEDLFSVNEQDLGESP